MGILAIILAMTAWAGSAAFLFAYAPWYLGVTETLLITGGLLAISFTYCTHCPLHKKGCVHGFIGIPARLLKDRSREPYETRHFVLTVAAIIPMVCLPQYWLFGNMLLFGIYWLLSAAAGAIVTLKVCPKCENRNCPMCPLNKPEKTEIEN